MPDGKISLTAKNPFGKDLDLKSPRTYVGLALFGIVIVGLGTFVGYVKGRASQMSGGVQGLYQRLRKG